MIILVLIIGDNAVYYLLSANCEYLVIRTTTALPSIITGEQGIHNYKSH
jgi:hypothetical protein